MLKFLNRTQKAIAILFHKGPGELFRSLKQFRDYQKEERELTAILGKNGLRPPLLRRNLIRVPYDAEYQDNMDFSGCSTDVRMLAFYLPQYHSFPENDRWWGAGFTEWNNVQHGEARFPGHYQPRVPHQDFGYYHLDKIETIKKQADLAKQHGIYGFCIYYYWFSGKRLMEKPLDMILEHPEIDLPFCLCWANESWTRAWDGQSDSVLIRQEYSDRDDVSFIEDIYKYLEDPRYIRVRSRPLILVYNPGEIPDCRKTFTKWRETARRLGIGEIAVWICRTFHNTAELLEIVDCIDAEVEFPPHNMWLESIKVHGLELGDKKANIYHYQCLVEYLEQKLQKEEKPAVPIHHGCMLAWDNAARRKDGWITYYAFSLQSLYRWVLAVKKRAETDFAPEERYIFLNAWNEWGEGTYLEPDEKYGYASINTVSKALFDLPMKMDLRVLSDSSPACEAAAFENNNKNSNPRIAVQMHLFYLDTLEECIQNLNLLPYSFDCFISTDTEEKKQMIEKVMKKKCICRMVRVQVFPNRGRDVAPFLLQMADCFSDYDYIGHFHSKKTKTDDHGEEWRRYIFRHLFGSREYLKRLFFLFEQDDRLGIIMPETYPVLEYQAEWGGNKEAVWSLLAALGGTAELPEDPVFPVGNMFWARTKAIKKLFAARLTQEDFPREAGQVNATTAHQIERSWVYIARSSGYHYSKVFNNCCEGVPLPDKKRLGVFMHYDAAQTISEEDTAAIRYYSELFTKLVFVTNSSLESWELDKVRPYVEDIYTHENIGLDFGGWRHCLLAMGEEEVSAYDELILLNNSCFKPVFDLREVFSVMGGKKLDFWGITVFPYSSDGSYIRRDCIPEHIQSYFMVFHHAVLQSPVFWDFWRQMNDYTDFIDVVGNCESQLTKVLANAGFTYEPYIRETYYLSRFLNNYAIPYEKPTSLLLLKDPFVKKKSLQYMNNEEKCKLKWLLQEIGAPNSF